MNDGAVSGGYRAGGPERVPVAPRFRRQSRWISLSEEDSRIHHCLPWHSEADEVCLSMTKTPALDHHWSAQVSELARHLCC